MIDLGADLAHRFDLDEVPYTVRFSRLFVRRGETGLTVFRAAYERSLADSVVVERLRVLDDDGAEAPVSTADPFRITFTGGAWLMVTPDDEIAVGLPDGWSVDHVPGPALGEASFIHPAEPPAGVIADLAEWLARCPAVDPRWRDVTRFAWWTLGVNTLVLDAPAGLNRAVVPSKIGYVGLWQWDAYFMAIGLRHGDPGLAREQLRIALAHPSTSGQLPDVVHEDGILASSDDLPPGDLENLRAMASPSLAHTAVPLTKPPLTALAVALMGDQSVVDEFLATMLAAQEWWYRDSAPAGRPAYLHPYSSGLDDSPIFDHEAILVSPDLSAYLVLADRLMAGWLRERGRDAEAERCTARADAELAALIESWNGEFFPSVGEAGDVVASETIVSLMPLLADGLPPHLVDGIVAAIEDPTRFATAHPLPTVAVRDPDFSETRMWRGPVWVNTNWLVAQGLRRQGLIDKAERLERATLELVAAQGPNEYFRPDTGVKPPRATTVFGWSAALTVDLAVAHS